MPRYSGKFVLRVPPDIHAGLHALAKSRDVSLNGVCVELLRRGLSIKGEDTSSLALFGGLREQLKTHFGEDLIGVVLFGSHARGEATRESDVDILVVLDRKVPLVRSLYTWWDENVAPIENLEGETNPHFVHHPEKPSDVTGIWFEVAEAGVVLFQKGKMMDLLFSELRQYIADGVVRKYSSNGHPYWVWREHEE